MEPLCRIRDIYRSISDFESVFYEKHGIKLNEGMLLCSLVKLGKCSSGQISEMLGLTKSNNSKVIVSAENKGLIKRSFGKADKRQMFFCITPKGKECIDNIHCDAEAVEQLIERIRAI